MQVLFFPKNPNDFQALPPVSGSAAALPEALG